MRDGISLGFACVLLVAFSIQLHASNITYHDNVAFAQFPADLQTNASLHDWENGFLDVTMAPFGADSSGVVDATAALQKAIDYAYDCNLVVFFPQGTYRVSSQLRMIHKQPPSGSPYSQTKFVHKLVGSTRVAQRPVIRLADQSTVTDNILMLFRYEFLDGSTDSSRHYAAELRNIDIDMGNNASVTAVSMNGAQYCVMENVAIRGQAFDTGIYNLPGSGGMVRNISITGGRVGINQSNYRPNPTIVGLRLSGQSEIGLRVGESRGAVTVIGFAISGSSTDASYLPISLPNNYNVTGSVSRANLNLIDGTIDFRATGGTAIYNKNADVVIKNVYIRAANLIDSGSVNGSSDILAGNVSRWYRIPQYQFINGSDDSHINFDGIDQNPLDDDYVDYDTPAWNYTADDMVRKHVCQYFPTHEQSVVNVCSDYSVSRDDDSDDDAMGIQQAIDDAANPNHANFGKAVFIPRGVFHISQPIVLKAGTQLIGAANNISVIHAHRTWKPANETQMIQTVSATTGKPIYLANFAIIRTLAKDTEQQGCEYVGYLKVDYYKTFIKDIQTGSLAYYDKWSDPSYAHATLACFEQHAGGKWYNCVMLGGVSSPEDNPNTNLDAAQLKIASTHDMIFYNSSIEHSSFGNGDRYIEQAQNLYIFGIKHESGYNIARIVDSSNLLLSGGSGNLSISANTQDPLIDIVDSDDLEISLLSRKHGSSEPTSRLFLNDGYTMLNAYDNIGVYRVGNSPLTVPTISYDIENLDMATANGLQDAGGNLTVSNGVASLSSATVLTHSMADDFELNLDLATTLPGSQSWFVGHLYLRYLDADNHYLIRLEPNGAIKFLKEVDGVSSVIQSVWNTGLQVDAMNHYRVVMRGSSIQLYVTAPGGSEQLILDSTACSQIQTGHVGIFARTSTVNFDNLVVTPLFK
ncbi:MAG: glycosyl hydrolase family 28-related protein [Phycisphaeraceae bacterium JB051]